MSTPEHEPAEHTITEGLGAPMFRPDRPFKFHIELTDKCNAACPMCQRTRHLDRCSTDYDKVRNIELSLADFKRAFPPAFCRNVSRIDLCGSLGDPPAARDCLEICDYLTEHGVLVTMSSNGGLRNRSWWSRLGEIFKRNGSFVEFHIDGLEDTNHFYRVNTRFDWIVRNVEAYLATGAEAEWHYIVFKHNEHQVDEAHRRAKAMGFREFKVIDTIRFGASQRFEYQMPDGSTRYLEPATRSKSATGAAIPVATRSVSNDRAAVNGIRCKSAVENRPYITADGTISACCWISESPDEARLHAQAGFKLESRNIHRYDLETMLYQEPYASLYRQSWERGESPICKRKCGLNKRSTRRTL